MYTFFSTLSKDADAFINELINEVKEQNFVTLREVFEDFLKIEHFDKKTNKPFYPGADMTKETKQDFVEIVSKITGHTEAEVWDIYDAANEIVWKEFA